MYLGWDIGIKNLAFCLMDYYDKKFHIIDWGVINLLDEHSNKKICCYLKESNDPNSKCGISASYQTPSREEFYCKRCSKKLSEEIIKNAIIFDIVEHTIKLASKYTSSVKNTIIYFDGIPSVSKIKEQLRRRCGQSILKILNEFSQTRLNIRKFSKYEKVDASE